MCGITGYWQGKGVVEASIATNMAAQIRHRGPDDSGVWLEPATGLALAHQRLSIIDLSAAGHQPMLSPCGRYVLIYNGEIYNHQDIRRELEKQGGHFEWRGHSDTETVLAALRHWGVETALKQFNGMFAFALWDRNCKKLYLARDRIGEKPLYYGKAGNAFLFGSELKSLRSHPEWQGEINRDALTQYLRRSCIPSPISIYKNIHKLPPGHFIVVSEGGCQVSPPIAYWSLGAAIGSTVSDDQNIESYVAELDGLLRDSVNRRMIADVPLGALLSGGVDSSAVVAIMQALSRTPVKTFSIGFNDPGFDEARHAKAVAKHLGTDHTELYVTPADALAVIPRIPEIWDEPFADPSQIPTLLVSQMARQYVNVSLSGDGGDELFCGYRRYMQGYNMWHKMRALPQSVRNLAIYILKILAERQMDKHLSWLPKRYQMPNLNDRLSKLASVLNCDSEEALYNSLISHWTQSDEIVLGAQESSNLKIDPEISALLGCFREYMMYADTLTYLPDDILTKVDRASMAASLEVRAPLLDHRIVEFAWKVPLTLKYREGEGKWLLRQMLYNYVPRALVDRPKMGFGVPLEYWLRGPLKAWAENLLDEGTLRQQGYFDPAPIRKYWHDLIQGKESRHYQLWDILMFQAWLEHSNA